MTKKKLFRDVALEQLSSPEQLDQMMQVVTPKGWLALGAIAALLIVIIGWAIFGSLGVVVGGSGLMLKTGTIRNVTSPYDGRISLLAVSEGTTVEPGPIVAQIFGEDGSQNVTSPFHGKVSEILALEGDVVDEGSPLFSVILSQADQETLTVITYLPATDAATIQADMPVRVFPATSQRDTHGFIFGQVTLVRELPSTRGGMFRTLGNEQWVNQFSTIESPVEIQIKLEANLDNPTGFQWSTGQGPLTPIGNGTPCEVEIVVDQIRPIELVIGTIN